jgi:alkylated DNA repair protein alkB homolog 7
VVDLLLEPRSLYVLRGEARYKYTHQILPESVPFAGRPVQRDRRISLIFRDELLQTGSGQAVQ